MDWPSGIAGVGGTNNAPFFTAVFDICLQAKDKLRTPSPSHPSSYTKGAENVSEFAAEQDQARALWRWRSFGWSSLFEAASLLTGSALKKFHSPCSERA